MSRVEDVVSDVGKDDLVSVFGVEDVNLNEGRAKKFAHLDAM